MSDTNQFKREPWHLDRRVPLALIISIIIQSGAVIWWMSSLHTTVENNRISIERLDAVVDRIQTSANAQAVQLGRIEEGLLGIRNDIQRLTNSLERQSQGR